MKTTTHFRFAVVTLFALLAIMARPAHAGNAGTLVVTLPTGDFSLWLEYKDGKGIAQATAPVKASGAKAALDLAPLGSKFTQPLLVALDSKTGNVAVKPAPAKAGKTTEMSLAASDINAVNTLSVRAVGSDRNPAGSGMVTLTDSKGTTTARPILPGHDGTAEFDRVPFGKTTIKVQFPDGNSASQELDVKADHAPGVLSLEVAAATPMGDAGKSNAAASEPAADKDSDTAKDAASDDKDTGKAPADQPAEKPATPTGTGGIGTLVGLVVLVMLGYVGVRVMRERGVQVGDLLRRAGVEIPGPETDAEQAKPAAPPAPKVPEGTCPFCGQPKDPVTGACACTVSAAAGASALAGAAAFPSSQGPSLVALQGPAAGTTFPLGSEPVSLGRAADNQVALPQDNSISRRHASITPQGDSFLLRDEGSSNGTFVNGMRITERVLQPGDEITLGATRLRFEK